MKKIFSKNITETDVVIALRKHDNVSQAMKSLGYKTGGGCYRRINEIIARRKVRIGSRWATDSEILAASRTLGKKASILSIITYLGLSQGGSQHRRIKQVIGG